MDNLDNELIIEYRKYIGAEEIVLGIHGVYS